MQTAMMKVQTEPVLTSPKIGPAHSQTARLTDIIPAKKQ